MKLIFDIETAGCELSDLSESQQEFILRYPSREIDEVKRKQLEDDAIRFLSLYPFTSEVVSIGMLNENTGNSMVLYRGEDEWESEDKSVKYVGCSEKEILTRFWDYLTKFKGIVTFNGKHFDAPFLMLRSAMLSVKPSMNIVTNKYENSFHIDLLEEFSYYGNVKKFNLDFYCHSFGITSPKSKGITGMEVKELFRAGKTKEIAIYCADDIKATFELYKIWKEYLLI